VKIAVLIKQTPDTAELPKVSADEVSSGSVQATMVINPWDEFAAEEAIDLSDRFDGDAVAFSMGSDGSTDALKHALAMGVGSAVLIDGDDSVAADDWSTAAVLAAAIVADGSVTVERLVDGGQELVVSPLPAVISVAKEINDPRYPSFMGIRKASKADIPTIAAAGLGVEASSTVS